jgi:hypothetical protein
MVPTPTTTTVPHSTPSAPAVSRKHAVPTPATMPNSMIPTATTMSHSTISAPIYVPNSSQVIKNFLN